VEQVVRLQRVAEPEAEILNTMTFTEHQGKNNSGVPAFACRILNF
jgi:hypothetical protein